MAASGGAFKTDELSSQRHFFCPGGRKRNAPHPSPNVRPLQCMFTKNIVVMRTVQEPGTSVLNLQNALSARLTAL
jgi:hypothetical protein